MIQGARIQGIIEGLKELHKYMGRIGGKPSIMLFNVQGYNVAAQSEEEKIAAGFLTYHTKPYYEVLQGMGVTVLNWDPIEETFASALQRQRVTG
jgi:maltose-binding protein MalE